jgi:hypothetical protein
MEIPMCVIRTALPDYERLTPAEWQAFMANEVVYIKPVVTEDGGRAFALHAADGTPLAIIANRESALGAVLAHDLEPASVH